MRKNIVKYLFILVLPLILLNQFAFADSLQTPENFVKDFYAVHASVSYPSFESLKKLKPYLSEKLYQLLYQAEVNRDKTPGEICGFLDFEPFIGSQTDVGNLKRVKQIKNPNMTMVKISFSLFPKKIILVELQQVNNKWKIDNLIYPAVSVPQDLRRILGQVLQEKCS